MDSISLPSDFNGPSYFNYAEGSIIGFIAKDSCIISILCGGNAILQIDNSYLKIDSGINNSNQKFFLYFSRNKNRFAREDVFHTNPINYENATADRKKILDMIFNSFKK
jgi:hypothetical protein